MFPLSLSLLVHTFELRFFRCVIHPMTIHQMLSQQKFQHQPSNRQKNGRCRLSELGITQQSVMLNTLILHISTSNQTSFFYWFALLILIYWRCFIWKVVIFFPGRWMNQILNKNELRISFNERVSEEESISILRIRYLKWKQPKRRTYFLRTKLTRTHFSRHFEIHSSSIY